MLRTLLTLLLLTGLFQVGAVVEAKEKPVVITSFSVIQDWTQIIGGKEVEVINIIPPLSEAHGFQLSPAQAKNLRKAVLIIGMHPDLEPWLRAWAEANQAQGRILWLHPSPNTPHGLADPHAWISPPEVLAMTKKIADAIRPLATSKDSQDSYHQYVNEVKRVDAELVELFAALPPDRRTIISQHANLGYFARRYGLKVAGTILSNGAAEAADPSARHFSELLKVIRQEGVRVVVADEGQNDAFARRLCEDAGLRPPLALTFEYLQPTGQPGDTWTSMMLTHGRRLHQALNAR